MTTGEDQVESLKATFIQPAGTGVSELSVHFQDAIPLSISPYVSEVINPAGEL